MAPFSKHLVFIFIFIFKDSIFKYMYKNRYPNGNSVAGAVGLTTGVGAGSPPYTPLPGAASPDQTTTTPLCHPISSNEGSYNLHHKSKGNTFSSSSSIIAIHLLPRHSILIEIRSFLNLQTSFEISKKLRLFFYKIRPNTKTHLFECKENK